jgi:hypothetical protein
MPAGSAVVAIWNDIVPSARAAFYDWHIHEHIPERVAIPGFRRGARYVATRKATAPQYFTLYEAASPEVLRGPDYAARLNAPTPATRRVTAHFRDTVRALAQVVESRGSGLGGMLLTVRFAAPDQAAGALGALLAATATAPRVTSAHLCRTDAERSGTETAESRGRTDLRAPPGWFALVEATDAAAFTRLLPAARLAAAGAGEIVRGVYRLEYRHEAPAAGAGDARA